LGKALQGEDVSAALAASRTALASRRASPRIHNARVQQRLASQADLSRDRESFEERAAAQQESLQLPAFPTTTIGSFPQTQESRRKRREWKQGSLSDAAYERAIRAEIEQVVRAQERLGLDVLVHGEAERNDMV